MPEKPKILLITMPWGSLYYPSLRLGLLKSSLSQNRIEADVQYLNLLFFNFITSRQKNLAEELQFTLDDYERIGHDRYGYQLGEWLFTHVLYDQLPASENVYFSSLKKMKAPKILLKKLSCLKEIIPDFLKWCIKTIPFKQYSIILFTTMMLQDPTNQNISSLALSKRIKHFSPKSFILFEGAHCQGSMGSALGRNFQWLDAVICGEGETVLPKIVSAILKGRPVPELPNVWTRSNPHQFHENGKIWSHADLNQIPLPDYDDYFSSLEKAILSRKISPALLVETSRGCWWGMKSHCTFCGLNGPDMKFRSKTPENFMNEIQKLTSRYKILEIKTTDNMLDMDYFNCFLENLKIHDLSLQTFFVVKPNLKKEQIRALREAGTRWLCGGIESLSSKHLRLMKKGCTAIQNLQFLKWCMEYGIIVQWNFLYGIPGEEPEDYAAMEKIIPLLTHLTPPLYIMPISLNRFSPYFNNPEEYKIQGIRPKKIYEWIYPQRGKDLFELAYSFDYNYEPNPETYTASLRQKVLRWQNETDVNLLTYVKGPDFIKIQDRRPCFPYRDILLNKGQALIYTACDQANSIDTISTLISDREENSSMGPDSILRFLKDMTKIGVMFEENGKYLSLALPYNPDYSLHEFVRGIGGF
jgi:ribosomal peptide maturation radical SAM protein 1